MTLEPVSVALKFGFLVVLYLFLLWVARSALNDLRRGVAATEVPPDATGMHSAASGLSPDPLEDVEPRLRVEQAMGLQSGDEYDVRDGATLGRGDKADIQLEDPFASSRHCRIVRQGDVLVLEDLNSTNGTWLNGSPLDGPQPLHPGDRIRIGDNEFSFVQ
ncbi:MAG TPA: FHA domain-containing protein [Solirubrobacteraceae bacterium]|nr:FHA domain-containing protein [Solirubrobacteraceae bacterium]